MDYTKQLEALDGQRRIDTLFYDKEKNNSCQISKLIKKKDMEKMSNPFDSDLSSDWWFYFSFCYYTLFLYLVCIINEVCVIKND